MILMMEEIKAEQISQRRFQQMLYSNQKKILAAQINVPHEEAFDDSVFPLRTMEDMRQMRERCLDEAYQKKVVG